MKLVCIYFYLFFFLFCSCTSVKKLNEKITVQKHDSTALKKDLAVLKTALEEAHPGLYWYTSKFKIDSIFNRVESQLKQPLTSREFFRLTAPAVTVIRDGHTRMIMPGIRKTDKEIESDKKKGKAPLSQFSFKIINTKLFITANRSSDSSLFKGSEIKFIDHIPVAELLNNLSSIFSSDGFNETFKNRYLEKQLNGLYRTYYNKVDSVVLTENGKDHLVTFYKEPADTSALFKKLKKIKEEEKDKRKYRGFDENDEPLLDLRIVSERPSTAVLKVRSFSFSGDDHRRFFKEAFQEIKDRNIQNVILDLRFNPGGKLSACKTLFSYLTNREYRFLGLPQVKDKWYSSRKYFDNRVILNIQNLFMVKKTRTGYTARLRGVKASKPNPLHYEGNLYVLINGYSFSASSLLAANLYGINRGTFIGEETGGGFNKCAAGIIPLVTLPETRVKLRLPLIQISPAITRDIEGHGVFPHHTVIPDLEDILNNKDTELDYTFKLIAQGK
jgi:C-terminal processing protease CtpA/Prc